MDMLLRKVVLILALGVSCNSAMAKWTKINDVYVDLSTIQKKSKMVKMWSMSDFKTPQEVVGYKKFLSTKERFEYDCIEVKSRQLSVTAYTGNMGKGAVIYKDSALGAWTEVDPDSLVKTQWNVACGKH
jgi:hypothetical protein